MCDVALTPRFFKHRASNNLQTPSIIIEPEVKFVNGNCIIVVCRLKLYITVVLRGQLQWRDGQRDLIEYRKRYHRSNPVQGKTREDFDSKLEEAISSYSRIRCMTCIQEVPRQWKFHVNIPVRLLLRDCVDFDRKICQIYPNSEEVYRGQLHTTLNWC